MSVAALHCKLDFISRTSSDATAVIGQFGGFDAGRQFMKQATPEQTRLAVMARLYDIAQMDEGLKIVV